LMLCHAAEGSSVLTSTTLRGISDDDLLGPWPRWALPHTLGVTSVHASGDLVVAGFGLGGVELYDTRIGGAARGPAMVLTKNPLFHDRSAFFETAQQHDIARSHAVTSLCFSPDGSTVACGTSDGLVRVWSLSKPSAPVSVVRHRKGGVRASWSPTHRGLLATVGGSFDGALAVSDTHRTTASSPHDGTALFAVNTLTQIANVDWLDGGSYVVTTHGFSFSELCARANLPNDAAQHMSHSEAPVIEAAARSICAWHVDLPTASPKSALSGGQFTLASHTRPSSGLSQPQVPLRTPLGVRPNGDNVGFQKPFALDAAAAMMPMIPSATASVRLKHPLEWDAVCISPLDSPAGATLDTLSVPRGRMNRLDLMPLAISDSVAAAGAAAAGAGHSGASAATGRRTGTRSLTPASFTSSRADSAPLGGLHLVGVLKSHSTRPLHIAKRRRATGQFVTASGGDGDESLRFWKAFNVVNHVPSGRGGSGAASAMASGCDTPAMHAPARSAFSLSGMSSPADELLGCDSVR
jgi:WD40 repeat protein